MPKNALFFEKLKIAAALGALPWGSVPNPIIVIFLYCYNFLWAQVLAPNRFIVVEKEQNAPKYFHFKHKKLV